MVKKLSLLCNKVGSVEEGEEGDGIRHYLDMQLSENLETTQCIRTTISVCICGRKPGA